MSQQQDNPSPSPQQPETGQATPAKHNLKRESSFQFPGFDRDVVFVAIGKGQSGKSHLLNSILEETESRRKPSFYLDIMGELGGGKGRIIVNNFDEFRECLVVNSAAGCPTIGTVIFHPSDAVHDENSTDEIFDKCIALCEWWSKKLKAAFPDDSRKLSLFFPELKEFTSTNHAPLSMRRLSTGGRHKFRIFYATQSALGQPSSIIGNCNYLVSFNMHMPQDQRRILEIHPIFEGIENLPEFHFRAVDLKKRAFFEGKL